MVLNTVPQIQALCLTIVRIIKCLYVCMYVQGGPKNWTVFQT